MLRIFLTTFGVNALATNKVTDTAVLPMHGDIVARFQAYLDTMLLGVVENMMKLVGRPEIGS